MSRPDGGPGPGGADPERRRGGDGGRRPRPKEGGGGGRAPGRPLAVRLYAALLRLLPPRAARDREATVALFARLRGEAEGWRGRWAVTLRGLGRLPGVLVAEWLDHLGARAAPGRRKTTMTTTKGGTMGLLRDLRYAARSLVKAPAFALSTTALIALGVGAVTTIFTLVDHVLLRPLPYPAQERLVHLGNPSHSGPFFQRLDGVESVESWAGALQDRVSVTVGDRPEQLLMASVTRGFFDLFGAHAVRGRLLEDADYAAADVVVVSGEAWRTHWGGDPGLVGRTVRVDGRPVVVVGILERAFRPPEALVSARVDLWRPVDWSAEVLGQTNYSVMQIAGRTRPGRATEVVQAEVDRLLASLAAEDEHFVNRDGEVRQVPVRGLAEATVQDVRQGLGLLMAAVGVLLLVACANVAHLFLARGLGRVREMAVRRAMGAGTATVARHLLAESLLVGSVGGLLGAGLAALGLDTLLALSPEALPRGAEVALDLRVLGFALAVSVATAVVFGLLPALETVRADLAAQLHGAGRTATGGRGVAVLRNVLVAGEVALSLILIAGAGLLIRSFANVQSQETGFRVERVWTVPLAPTGPETEEEYVSLTRELTRALTAVPGVEEVAVGLTMPLQFTGGGRCCWGSRVEVDGVDLDDTRINMHPVTGGYFSTLELEMLAGRGWSEGEAAGSPVPVVLSEPLAIQAFGSAGAAVGRALQGRRGPDGMQMRVVGVVADTRHYGLDQEHGPALYLPLRHVPFVVPLLHPAVRVAPGARGVPAALREAIWEVAPSLPVPTVRSMEEWMGRATAERRFRSALFGAFALVALLLAAGGLYGTLLFVAGQRRREVGIRLALGASRAHIERKLLSSGLAVTAVGIAVGLAGAWVSGRLLESWIWGVERGDPVTLGGAAALLLVTAAVASWLPARKAGRTDPLETLRAE